MQSDIDGRHCVPLYYVDCTRHANECTKNIPHKIDTENISAMATALRITNQNKYIQRERVEEKIENVTLKHQQLVSCVV